MFNEADVREHISERTVEITWQNSLSTQSCFKWYGSKNELRITRLGRGFPYLRPDMTGALFVLTQQGRDVYCGYMLETEDEINDFLNAFGLTPADTNCMIDVKYRSLEAREESAIQNFIAGLTVDFPESGEMSEAARRIEEIVRNCSERIRTDPDNILLSWTRTEYALFRALERARYGDIIGKGFSSVEQFVTVANQVLNRRKSRAGKSLEHHLGAIFTANALKYSAQPRTEGHKRPDFIFPSEEAYHDLSFPTGRLVVLAAKTTCKDRWRQILNEANRMKTGTRYLCTLQPGISIDQMSEMKTEGVQLVVPAEYISNYPREKRGDIWTLKKFIDYVKEVSSS